MGFLNVRWRSRPETEVLIDRDLVLTAAIVLIRAGDRHADAVVHEDSVGQERLPVHEPLGGEEDRERRGFEASQHATSSDHVACRVGRDAGDDRTGTHRDVAADRDHREHLERHLDHALASLRIEVDVARAARFEIPGSESCRGRKDVSAAIYPDVVDAVQLVGGAVRDKHPRSDRAFEGQEPPTREAALKAVDR